MATSKPPYDPVKTVEGMFNGSVTRIAYAMKDPVNYAQSTKAVLAETAKKFQDALDDCEIQILDAKWYLERQLALNKARREAKAREEIAAKAKRKRDESKDSQDQPQSLDKPNVSKRVKTDEPEDTASTLSTAPQPKPEPTPTPPIAPATLPQKSPVKPAEKPEPSKPKEKPKLPAPPPAPAPAPTPAPVRRPSSARPDSKPSQIPPPVAAQKPKKPAEPVPAPVPEPVQKQPPVVDNVPLDTPATGTEDFNFVSMFGEPSGADLMDASNNELPFDLTFEVDADAAAAAQDSSLTSLLPGLESYANQTGDDNTFNLGGGTGSSDLNSISQPYQQGPTATTDFGLPTLGPNEFDDFLNSNDMNFDAAIDDGMMNMDSMDSMDIDFDSMFK